MIYMIKKLLFLSLTFLVLLSVYLGWSWFAPQVTSDSVVMVEQGSSLSRLARILSKKGIIDSRDTFIYLAHIRGDTRTIRMGEYRLNKGMSQNEILSLIVSGEVITYPAKFLEGWTFYQLREQLKKLQKLKHTLEGLSDKEIMKKLGSAEIHPEGNFYPDTYFYTAGSTDLMILKKAYDKMQKNLDKHWTNRDVGLPYKSKYEALIMASIIEKETGRPDERPLIASVFINRLKKNIKLQTDPTVIYGMGKNYNGNIRKKDLRRDTPYNTYTRKGLPPTPIAMPGEDSINAAVHPAKSDAIFFVARGDGTHVFSKNLKEHNKAVKKYQLKQK